MDKRKRQQAIKNIVAQEPIATQDDLVRALNTRGFMVTQATVSRDIAEIPLQKVRTASGLLYHWRGRPAEPGDRLARIVREFVVEVSRSENLVLLKTDVGTAQTVAASLDEARLEPVLGTVAGDDTVLVVAGDRKAGRRAHKMLAGMAETGGESG